MSHFPMTATQMVITIAVVILATVMTRFIPYILFPEGRVVPKYVRYLGKVLAPAVFGLLVVYCLRNVHFVTSSTHGLPEILACLLVIATFLWKKNMLISMASGTALYMILIRIM